MGCHLPSGGSSSPAVGPGSPALAGRVFTAEPRAGIGTGVARDSPKLRAAVSTDNVAHTVCWTLNPDRKQGTVSGLGRGRERSELVWTTTPRPAAEGQPADAVSPLLWTGGKTPGQTPAASTVFCDVVYPQGPGWCLDGRAGRCRDRQPADSSPFWPRLSCVCQRDPFPCVLARLSKMFSNAIYEYKNSRYLIPYAGKIYTVGG